MPTKSEAVLIALAAAVEGRLPVGTKFYRNSILPLNLTADGIVILRDGNPGDPEMLMSPPTYVYEHAAEFDVVVNARAGTDPSLLFDTIKAAIGLAIATDRTLGGLCDHVEAEAPILNDEAVEGGLGMTTASIPVKLIYATSDPLA